MPAAARNEAIDHVLRMRRHRLPHEMAHGGRTVPTRSSRRCSRRSRRGSLLAASYSCLGIASTACRSSPAVSRAGVGGSGGR